MNSDDSNVKDSQGVIATREPVPVWLFVCFITVVYFGLIYFDLHGGWFDPKVYTPYNSFSQLAELQPTPKDGDVLRGKKIFDSVCALCHNTDGSGKPNQAPPLAGSEWVVNPQRLIRIPLYGLGGPIKVKDQVMTFPSSMPAIGSALSDEDIAAVLSYVRTSWSNKGSPIKAEQVGAVRKKVGNRTLAFTPEELMQVQ